MVRRASQTTYALTDDISTTAEMQAGEHAGVLFVEAHATAATITWHGAYEKGGTYFAIEDSAGNAVTNTIGADQCLVMNANLKGIPYLKGVLNGGTATVRPLQFG